VVPPANFLISAHARLKEVFHVVLHNRHNGAVFVAHCLDVVMAAQVHSYGFGRLNRQVRTKESPPLHQVRRGPSKFEVIRVQNQEEFKLGVHVARRPTLTSRFENDTAHEGIAVCLPIRSAIGVPV